MNSARQFTADFSEHRPRATSGRGNPPVLSINLAFLLVGGLLAIEIIVPFLIQFGLAPSAARHLDNLLMMVMSGWLVARMLVGNRIPVITIVLLVLAVIGSVVAAFEGQGFGATAWGLWELIKFPLVGLFVYLEPGWPKHVLGKIGKLLYAILGVVVLVQVLQWVAGEVPGDTLAGTFGSLGTARLMLFLCLVLCYAFADWIIGDDSRTLGWLVAVVFLCGISSVLGEMKLFFPITAAIGGLTMFIYLIRGGKFWTFLPSIVGLVLLLTGSIYFYDRVVSDTRGTARLSEYFDLTTTEQYLNGISYDSATRTFSMRRGTATVYAWSLLQRDVPTLLFGYGLGARTESKTLGIIGRGLEQEYYGLLVGTSLLVMSQELGLVGIAALLGVFVWIIVRLLSAARTITEPGFRTGAYAIALFTILWPVWLWYSTVWAFGVTMVLYWGIVGLLMWQIDNQVTQTDEDAYPWVSAAA